MFEVLKGHTGSCQRRTCLKWEINGELSALDRQNLMQLLCQVDKQACVDDGGINPQPGHASVSQCESTANRDGWWNSNAGVDDASSPD